MQPARTASLLGAVHEESAPKVGDGKTELGGERPEFSVELGGQDEGAFDRGLHVVSLQLRLSGDRSKNRICHP